MIARLLAMAPTDTSCSEFDKWNNWAEPGTCASTPGLAQTVIQNTVIAPWVEDMKRGVADAIKTMITFWISVPDPQVGTIDGVTADSVQFLQSKLTWLAAVIMCMVVLVGAMRIAIEQSSGPAKQLGKMIASYIGTSVMAVPLITVGLLISSGISQWILASSTEGTNFADNLFSLFNSTEGVTSGVFLFVLLLIAALLAGLQCWFMIGRGAALIVLTGYLLIIAAGSGLKAGAEGLQKAIAWIVALIIYKMVAAGIYGVGFFLLGTNTSLAGNGFLQIMQGITLIGLAIFALPATMRVVAPAMAPAADGRGWGAAAGGMVLAMFASRRRMPAAA